MTPIRLGAIGAVTPIRIGTIGIVTYIGVVTPIRLGAIGIVTYIWVVTHQLRKPSPPSRSLAPERNWRRGPTVGVTTHRFRLADFVNRHTRTPVGVVTYQFRLVPPLSIPED